MRVQEECMRVQEELSLIFNIVLGRYVWPKTCLRSLEKAIDYLFLVLNIWPYVVFCMWCRWSDTHLSHIQPWSWISEEQHSREGRFRWSWCLRRHWLVLHQSYLMGRGLRASKISACIPRSHSQRRRCHNLLQLFHALGRWKICHLSLFLLILRNLWCHSFGNKRVSSSPRFRPSIWRELRVCHLLGGLRVGLWEDWTRNVVP